MVWEVDYWFVAYNSSLDLWAMKRVTADTMHSSARTGCKIPRFVCYTAVSVELVPLWCRDL